jgi:hypothetical protein
MAERTIHFPHRPFVEGRGFGRNIRHDPRSFRYRIGTESTPTTVFWDRHGPILDQGNLGSCVANTGADLLLTGPFWSTVPEDLKATLSDGTTAETWAVDLYKELTSSDDYPGAWPPDDTGSDGLTLGKVLTRRGLISGYQHAMTVGEAHTAIQAGPFAIGTVWLSNMEDTDANGVVKVAGQVLGGHEYLCFGYDATKDLWWFDNHWTPQWGKNGTFAYTTAALQKLMNQQGDITVMVPATAPAPQPSPEPDPAPVGVNQPDWNQLDPFIAHPRGVKVAQAAAAELNRWKSTL